MAGKKGMKQARPKTQEERDNIALGRIEYLIDQLTQNGILTCQDCGKAIPWKDINASAVSLVRARYDKLRATKTEATITHKSSIVDVLREISPQNQAHKPEPKKDEERPALH